MEIKAHGEAQRVGFRYAIKRQADALAPSGFAANEPEGSVVVEIMGERERLLHFFAWLQGGVYPARITKLRTGWFPIVNILRILR